MKFYINWFDIVILLFLAGFIWNSIKNGFITLALVSIFFFAGLFLSGWIFPHLLPIHDRTLLTIVNGNLVLLAGIGLAVVGFRLGHYFHITFKKAWQLRLETGISVFLSLCIGLIVIWLITSMIGRLPFEAFSNSVNDSLIVQFLDEHLPTIPAVFAEFNRELNPNSPPQIFIRTKFQVERYTPINSTAVNNIAATAEYSTVRITSFGCGGIVNGSGFVIAPDLVLTNAHVVAGVHRPIIKYGNQSYAGVPVLYNSNLDLAALRLTGFKAKPLSIYNKQVSPGATAVILGYPGGNYTISPATVIDKTQLLTTNLYGVGTVNRQVYELQAMIGPGSSGGPMLLLNGQVAGIVFAKPAIGNYAYTLTSISLRSEIQQAKSSTRRVSTGTCLSN
jgi:S1-C subfamily serine protease